MNDTIKEQIGVLKEEIAFLKDKYKANLLYLLALLSGLIGLISKIGFDVEKVNNISILLLIGGYISITYFYYHLFELNKKINQKFKRIKELINELK